MSSVLPDMLGITAMAVMILLVIGLGTTLAYFSGKRQTGPRDAEHARSSAAVPAAARPEPAHRR